MSSPRRLINTLEHSASEGEPRPRRAPSLVSLATQQCVRFSYLITDIGDSRYELVYPILRKMTFKQLHQLEKNCPHIKQQSGDLWKQLIARDFPHRPLPTEIYDNPSYKGVKPYSVTSTPGIKESIRIYNAKETAKFRKLYFKYYKDEQDSLKDAQVRLQESIAKLEQEKIQKSIIALPEFKRDPSVKPRRRNPAMSAALAVTSQHRKFHFAPKPEPPKILIPTAAISAPIRSQETAEALAKQKLQSVSADSANNSRGSSPTKNQAGKSGQPMLHSNSVEGERRAKSSIFLVRKQPGSTSPVKNSRPSTPSGRTKHERYRTIYDQSLVLEKEMQPVTEAKNKPLDSEEARRRRQEILERRSKEAESRTVKRKFNSFYAGRGTLSDDSSTRETRRRKSGSRGTPPESLGSVCSGPDAQRMRIFDVLKSMKKDRK